MGNSVTGARVEGDAPFIVKDVVPLILRAECLSLADFFHCMLVCKAWRDICQSEEMWMHRLRVYTDQQYQRTHWTGYSLIPHFFSVPEFAPFLREYKKTFSWEIAFSIKRILRERFERFTGWTSLLQHHFLEAYFNTGSEPPCIVYCGFLRKGVRHGPVGISFHSNGIPAFIGPFYQDQPEGKGRTFWKNGTLQYEGSFVLGKKRGMGKQYYATGTYVGEWNNDLPSGRGSWEWKDGRKFVGIMKEGKRCGFGILLHKNGEKEHEGEWSDDLLNGFSKTYRDDGTLRYEGNYVDGLCQGKGRLIKENRVYEGEFFQGKREGFGVLFDGQGKKLYEGQWKNDLFHGPGTLYGDAGEPKKGDWRKGKPKGNDESVVLEASFLEDSETSSETDETE